MKIVFLSAAALLLTGTDVVDACTNILVSKGASVDGSTQIAYNADSGNLYGSLGHYPAQKNVSANATRRIWDWDGAFFLGAPLSIAACTHAWAALADGPSDPELVDVSLLLAFWSLCCCCC
jgi:hypothetical protein